MYVSKIFFLSLFISFFFFRSPVVLGQECKVRYRSVAFKQVFEGLEGLSLSTRETNSRRTGENVRNPHSFGGIARFVIFFPNNLISRRGRILGKCSLSLSLSASFEMWRILELTSSQEDKGNGLVDMHTGIQYLRGIFRSSSFARHAYLICRYEYETWCFSIPYTIRSRKKKKKEKRKGEKINSLHERTREQRCERTLNDIDAKLSDGRSTAVFGIPLRIWRVQKYQGHFCPRRNESEALNLYAPCEN